MTDGSHISLLIEGYPRTGYQTYAKMVGGSTGGLCIGRLHPDYVAQKYGLDRAKRYWLSNQKGEDVISPKSLHHLVKVVRSELRGRAGGKVLLDGLEYLLLFNDMAKVLSALEEIEALLRQANVELIIVLDPLTLEEKDLVRLWDLFPRYTAEELLGREVTVRPQLIAGGVPATVGPEMADL